MNEYDEDVTHEIEHAKWLEWYLGEDESYDYDAYMRDTTGIHG